MFLCADEIVLANLPFKEAPKKREGEKCPKQKKRNDKKIIILDDKLLLIYI